MKQELVLSNDLDKPAVGLRALFVLKRTIVLSASLNGLPDPTSLVALDVSPNGISARWTSSLAPGATVILSLDIEGEPIEVAEVRWRSQEGVIESNVPSFDAKGAMLIAADDVRGLKTSAVAMHAARQAYIESLTDPQLRMLHAFFYDYDSNTHPQLVPVNPSLTPAERQMRLAIIPPMADLLSSRVLQRAAWIGASSQGPAPQLPRSTEEDVRYVSRVQLQVYARHFTGSSGQFDHALAWTAFEAFSNGELRVQISGTTWNSEPDSAFEFSFAEFAFMAIELGVDAAEWSALLPGLVASQRVFAAAYRPHSFSPPYFYSDYRPHNFLPAQQVDDSTKQELRARFGGMPLDELWLATGRNAYETFPGGGQRPT